jgi:hypothetical protein
VDVRGGVQPPASRARQTWPRRLTIAGVNGQPQLIRRSLIVGSDSDWLACAGDGGVIHVWDPTTGNTIRVLAGHDGPVTALIPILVSGGPGLLSAGADGTVRFWDVMAALEVISIAAHTAPVRAVCLSALDGGPTVATGGDDGFLRLWDAVTGAALSCAQLNGSPPRRAHGLTAVGDGRIVAVIHPSRDDGFYPYGGLSWRDFDRPASFYASADPEVLRWNPTDGTLDAVAGVSSRSPQDVHVAHIDGQDLLVCADQLEAALSVTDLTTGEPHQPTRRRVYAWLARRHGSLRATTLLGEDLLAGVDGDQRIVVQNLRTGRIRALEKDRTSYVHAVCGMTLEGRPVIAAARSDGTVRLLDQRRRHVTTVWAGNQQTRSLCPIDSNGLTADTRLLLPSQPVRLDQDPKTDPDAATDNRGDVSPAADRPVETVYETAVHRILRGPVYELTTPFGYRQPGGQRSPTGAVTVNVLQNVTANLIILLLTAFLTRVLAISERGGSTALWVMSMFALALVLRYKLLLGTNQVVVNVFCNGLAGAVLLLPDVNEWIRAIPYAGAVAVVIVLFPLAIGIILISELDSGAPTALVGGLFKLAWMAASALFLYAGFVQPGSSDAAGFGFRTGFDWLRYTPLVVGWLVALLIVLAVVALLIAAQEPDGAAQWTAWALFIAAGITFLVWATQWNDLLAWWDRLLSS